MKKLMTLLLGCMLFLGIFFASACGFTYEVAPESGAQNSEEVNSSTSSTVNPSEPQGTPYKVVLKTSDGSQVGALDGVYAIWTENTTDKNKSVYKASFNKEGIATSFEPDGDYTVSLSKIPTGYTYNPNVYTANNKSKETVIVLLPVLELNKTKPGNYPENYDKIQTTGAYRFTFTSPGQQMYFEFGAKYDGNISFESLIDVTKGTMTPIFWDCGNPNYNSYLNGQGKRYEGGGVEGGATKNFYLEMNLTGSQDMLFMIELITSTELVFPVTMDIVVGKTDYIDATTGLTEVPVPTLNLPDHLKEPADNEYGWRAKIYPGTTFKLLADSTIYGAANTFDESYVAFDEATGLYYLAQLDAENKPIQTEMMVDGKKKLVSVPDLEKPLYARLAKDVAGIIWTEDRAGWHDLGLSFRDTNHYCKESGKNYLNFFNEYMKCVTDGERSYPVDANLKQYLWDVSISKRVFFDGKGLAEGYVSEDIIYHSNLDSRWLFVCGYYE